MSTPIPCHSRDSHLIKLVDETHPLVGKDQGPSLQRPLARDGAPLHIRRQSHGRRPLPRRENGAWRNLLDVLEELRLGGAGIAAQEDVDVAPHLVLLAWCSDSEICDAALHSIKLRYRSCSVTSHSISNSN